MSKFQELYENVIKINESSKPVDNENLNLRGPNGTHSLGKGLYGLKIGEPIFKHENGKFRHDEIKGYKMKFQELYESISEKAMADAIAKYPLGRFSRISDGKVEYYEVVSVKSKDEVVIRREGENSPTFTIKKTNGKDIWSPGHLWNSQNGNEYRCAFAGKNRGLLENSQLKEGEFREVLDDMYDSKKQLHRKKMETSLDQNKGLKQYE